jgi:1-acyl-sn-glycerol-3-phosphate acyltransferase
MLRSMLIVSAALFLTALTSLCAIVAAVFSPAGKASRRIARPWARVLLYLAGTKIEVIGMGNIITEKPQIFMANHQSDFDILIFLAAIPVDFLWIAKKELFRIPIFGQAMKKAGYISIDRRDPKQAMQSIDEAAEKLKEGISVATFPEGTRSRDGKLLPFKQGMFYLAVQAGVPIVPVSIIGSGKIMQKQSFRVNKGKIIMVIDKPVDVNGYTIETRSALMDRVRNIIAATYEKYQTERVSCSERGPM